MKNALIIAVVLALVGIQIYRTPLVGAGLTTTAGTLLLLTVCLGPACAWIIKGRTGLPLFETYCLAHLLYYWWPALKNDSVLWQIPEEFRLLIFWVVALFLLVGCAIYYGLMRRPVLVRMSDGSFWRRSLQPKKMESVAWGTLLLWLGYQLALVKGWMPDTGSATGAIRAVFYTFGIFAVLYFSLLMGMRRLTAPASILFVCALIGGVVLSLASGFLNGGAILLATFLFALAIGGKEIPVGAAIISFAMLSFLNLGKVDFRQRFWPEDTQGTPAGIPLAELYSYWIQHSWENMQYLETNEDEDEVSLTGRTDLTRMVGLVLFSSPRMLPFLDGESYWLGLELFIPKFLWKGRPDVHYPMQKMGLYYGVHTQESMEMTSISFGQIAEAWANFGWAGIVVVGALFGALFGFARNLAQGDDPLTVGCFFGMMFISLAVNLEHSAGAWLMGFSQAAVIALPVLFLLSDSQQIDPPQAGDPPEAVPGGRQQETVAHKSA
jgi:hypothetical protein